MLSALCPLQLLTANFLVPSILHMLINAHSLIHESPPIFNPGFASFYTLIGK